MTPIQNQKIVLQLGVALCLSCQPPPVLSFAVGGGTSAIVKYSDVTVPSKLGFIGNRGPSDEGPIRHHHHSYTQLFSSQTSDAIIEGKSNNKYSNSSSNTNAEEKAQQLREKARALRLEATTAEQNLRTLSQQK